MGILEKQNYLQKNKNIYLLFGDEKYLIKKASNSIIANVVSEENATMNIDYFTGKDIAVDRIIDAMFTYSFFADNRCVVVKDSNLFKNAGNKNLIQSLEEIPDTNFIVFIESDVDKTNALYKAIKKHGVIYEMSTPKENDLVKWVEGVVRNKGSKIKRDATIHLLRTVEVDMVTIDNEIEKLVAYTLNKGVIEKTDIDKICTKSLQIEIFKLMDAIGNKQVQKALEIYNDMIFSKEPVLKILVMLARQIKLILLCKELNEKGAGLNDISSKVGIHSFIAKSCIAQSRNFKTENLVKALFNCSKLESSIKTGQIKDYIGLETLIISLF